MGGGSTIVVVGQGLSGATTCSFGNELTPAIVISDMMVRCRTPYHVPATVQVKVNCVSDDGVHYVTGTAEFLYKVMNTRVDNVHPSSSSLGGGTQVTVRGSGFSMGSFCRFGDDEVPVVFYSTDHVTCVAPPRSLPGAVALEVSQIGHNEGYSEDGHKFTYESIPSVTLLSPGMAPEFDSIKVLGQQFTVHTKCYFGGRPSSSVQVLSETEMQCSVPKMSGKSQEVVLVSDNPNDIPTGHVVFKYKRPAAGKSSIGVREIIPTSGPTSGGTVVTVHGVNFPSDALCRFGDLYVTASVMTDKTLQCTSPQHRAAGVSLEVVSDDRNSFSSSFIKFSFQDTASSTEDDLFDAVATGEPEIERVEPATQRAGGLVALYGQRFSSVGFCMFSDEKTTLQVRATVIDSAHVTCKVPELTAGAFWVNKIGNVANVNVKFMSLAGIPSKSVPLKIASA